MPRKRQNNEKTREYNRRYYQKNTAEIRKARRKHCASHRNRNRLAIFRILEASYCVDCGESDPLVLEFDHRDNKRMNVANLISSYSLATLMEEVDKCDIRCANCHRRKTSREQNQYRFTYKARRNLERLKRLWDLPSKH